MKYLRASIALTLFYILFTGFAFPYLVTGLAQAAFPRQANGSMVERNGTVVGSELIGQTFTGAQYFHSRPSAAGNGYDGNNSSGTNLGPTNPKLLEGADGFDGVKQLADKYRAENEIAVGTVLPVDAVTRSASGLDPHISPRNAELQVSRVAKARHMAADAVRDLISKNTELPFVGIFGEARVNVLKLNLALDAASK